MKAILLALAIAATWGHWRHAQIAPFYGPGLYGSHVACGGKPLTRTMRGVAHRKLQCGTRVELKWHGRRIVTTVIDRGPYPETVGIPNRKMPLDLTARTMKDLTGRYSTVHDVKWRIMR
jgi:hypothetical protein